MCVYSLLCLVDESTTHSLTQTHRQYLSFVVVSWSEAVSQSEIWAKSQQLFLVLGAGQTIRAQIYNSPMGAEACVSHWSTESLYFSLPFCWSLFSCLMSLWLVAPCFSPSLIPSLCFFLLLFLFSFDDNLLCNMCERLGLKDGIKLQLLMSVMIFAVSAEITQRRIDWRLASDVVAVGGKQFPDTNK